MIISFITHYASDYLGSGIHGFFKKFFIMFLYQQLPAIIINKLHAQFTILVNMVLITHASNNLFTNEPRMNLE